MAPFKFLGMSPRFSPAGDEVEDSRTPQTTSRPQSARQAEEVQNRNAAVPHRLRRALHQQPRRTRSADDEGQDEDLRRLPDPRGRADFRAPQVRRLDREKAALQHPAGPHRDPRAAHAIPRRLTVGRSHAARARRGGGFGGTERGRTERGDAAPSEPTRKRSPGRYRPAADADPEHLEPSQPRRSKPRRTPWAGAIGRCRPTDTSASPHRARLGRYYSTAQGIFSRTQGIFSLEQGIGREIDPLAPTHPTASKGLAVG